MLVLLSGAEEENRFPGDVRDRDRRAARGIDIRFRQDRAVDGSGVVELLCPHHGILSSDGLVDEQRHIGIDDAVDLFEL